MTADTEANRRESDMTGADPGRTATGIVRTHLVFASIFLIFSTLAATAAAAQLVWPTLFEGIVFFSYGRLVPIATSAFLYGWLTLGFLAAVYYILPRVTRVEFDHVGMALVSLFLITVGVGAGMVGIYLGATDGRRYLEMPLWADVFVFAGLLLAALAATRTVAQRARRLGPPQWYLLGATWWIVLAFLAGNVPGLPGYVGQFQESFYRASMTGLWFAAAGIGVVYYLIPKLVGADPMNASPLTVLGFWSLAFVWAGTGPVDFIYGAGPDWLETLGVAFSIGLLVPIIVIFADFAIAMRGRWDQVQDRVALGFVVAGAWLFALIPVYNLLLALRTSSAVVQFTEWVPGFEALAFYGAFSMWVFAFAYHALSGGRGPARSQVATWHLGLSLIGVFLMVFAMTVGGLVTGFTWAAGANAGEPTSYGAGFEIVLDSMSPYFGVRFAGFVVFVLAQVLFLIAVFGKAAEPATADPVTTGLSGTSVDPGFEVRFEDAAKVPSWNALRYGVVFLFLGAFVVTLILPAFDPDVSAGTILGDEARVYPAGSAVAAGRAVYVREGCVACHTQEVREIVPDVGLGAVSEAGDYVHENPIQRGSERLGPDLMHVASRDDTGSADFIRVFLVDPQAVRPWSTMPSYSYLDDTDLEALTQYIVSLR